jgi:nitroimidazol reductase NimA-like FMN-containing flavoprotein (pyridoxamine 5'-phosphate oxidase superfamily)
MRDRAVTDRAELDRLLDHAIVAHVGMTAEDGAVVVIPTAMARDGDRVLVHGSTGSGWMRRAAAGAPACVAVTDLTGIIVARSAFENSFRYRSAVLFGSFTRLAGQDVPRALDLFTERFLPGRLAEVRPTSRRELAATMVLGLPIQDWSLKISTDWSTDTPGDLAGTAWAGVIPFRAHLGEPQPAPGLRTDIPIPASVRALTRHQGQAPRPADEPPIWRPGAGMRPSMRVHSYARAEAPSHLHRPARRITGSGGHYRQER